MSTQASCVPLSLTASPTPAGRVRLRALDAATYQRHPLHGEDRAWTETNCYVDLWIETLHGLGLDPVPALAFTLALDFEGDQYTFYKFAHEDLRELYGVEVQELNVWKGLVEHCAEQVAMGRVIAPEMDSWYLPDTAGVSYRIEHTKTTIAIQDIDVEAKRLGYWHGASYYELSGEDFDGVFRLDPALRGPNVLPPFCEIIKLGAMRALPADTLLAESRRLLRKYLARRPAANPIAKHRANFDRDLEWMRAGDPQRFHQYAFATFRQVGSCFELAASYLQWLAAQGEPGLDEAVAAADTIAKTAKTIQFKLARAVTLRRDVDFAPMFDAMEQAWGVVMDRLDAAYGGAAHGA